ncbi:ABC transporter ATP-binding protein [Ectopseudomonas oleovorans]|uniref:ABC transporter ATP-binding protein n=1 Tax=Ectopseudomonas oleovorans TaxID=301 RepID=UPI0019D084E1|nr:ABC transporter ATP-binding protein [Pseudomonas oleovorans]MBN7119672.1 ABC transporter ATP-binding protein [Pseudomonas oleovorans]MBN7131263.1 ABC transporter ATP-binding protein [Pseudomonas oleovorans]MBN7140425.1 ABC transporter ATP-binding protein [Pseudomonas oleovorans]
MSSDTAIKVENLSKCFQAYNLPRDRLKQFFLPRLQRAFGFQAQQYHREFWALKDVSFEVKKGETVGIIGRNGSGKSTLLQMICGTLNPSSGRIQTHGRIAALLELGSGFNPEFTGIENIYLNGAILGLEKREIDEKLDAIAQFADIGDFISQPIKTYSSGMVVRLAFSVAVHVEPKILIVDEALSVGDELFQRKCFAKIGMLRETGVTILFVSHSSSTIIEQCDRAILLDSTELLAIGDPKPLIGMYQKLIYAPESCREEIRKDIKSRNTSLTHELSSFFEPNEEILSAEALNTEEFIQETYDHNFKPLSTLSYESHGAKIFEASIYNSSGAKVNNLNKGSRYFYRYKVAFKSRVENVDFGMMIKTTSGIELGGARTATSLRNSISSIEPNEVYEVEFSFICHMSPGVYYLNAGVVGELNGNHTFLHRILDVAIFRVISSRDEHTTGIVDFLCIPKFQRIENDKFK